jgi:2-dehydropantoate 2-reductase
MRVGVIGAGAVGGAIAALLARAGHQVEVTARGAHLESIREGGIRLSGVWGDYTARVDAAERLTRAPEMAVLATKAQDSSAALRENAGLLSGIPLVVVQNGLDGVAIARRSAPGCDVVGALAMFASSYLSPGTITVTTPGRIYLGADEDHDVPARFAARLLGAVLPTSVTTNFVGAQWSKLVFNQVNALPAITGLSVQEVAAHPVLVDVLTRSMRETVRIAERSGIRFEPLQGLTDRRLRLFAALPPALGKALPRLQARRMGSTPNPGSTLQSIRRGQVTEIDYLNGAVVRAAKAAGTTAPINEGLTAMVHEVERTGMFLSPLAVARRVLPA